MDTFNKTISFVLGLVVVLVFLAVVTGRLNLRSRLPLLSGKLPTPTMTNPPLPTQTPTTINTYNKYQTNREKKPVIIPATGSPTALLPILFSGLFGGIFLKKITKK